jgi:hypothetical protein
MIASLDFDLYLGKKRQGERGDEKRRERALG